ncbi:MAG: hypothetical protein OXM59_12315 [Gammaproteobacteria bacterium]|nr:hypothetical protein [Gammaproteobacteria bacterium]
MMSKLDNLVSRIGYEKACQILEEHSENADSTENTLTIVVNRGVHHLPGEYAKGEVYFASEGNLDFSSKGSVRAEHERVLSRVAQILKKKRWHRIYLIPFGPNTLSMQIKLLVYRITRIETQDLFYAGGGEYFCLDIRQRDIIIDAG